MLMSNRNLEIERKYIIAMPDFKKMQSMESYTKSDILQIYLPSENGNTHRIRRRTYTDKTVYFETVKVRVDKMSSNEFEREISEAEFNVLASSFDPNTHPIEKTRHTFIYNAQLFEIDVYPEWMNTAIMETELESRDTLVEMPGYIQIVREVTGDKRYSNAGMSRIFPEEDHL